MKKHFKLTINNLHKLKIESSSRKKIIRIQKNVVVSKKDSLLEKSYINTWKQLGTTPSLSFLRTMISISGVESYLFVPENIHYNLIEPVLNNKIFSLAYNDKNFFERFIVKYKELFPEVILRGINGFIYDRDYRKISITEACSMLHNNQMILKPSIETGGGSNVHLVEIFNNQIIYNLTQYSVKEFVENVLAKIYDGNFILQKRVKQHEWFDNFNSSSINTVRLYTYRSVKDDIVYPLSAYIRFGQEGSIVDSSSQGGMTCGVLSNGYINKYAIGKYGEKYLDIIPLLKNKNTAVPFFTEMKEIAKNIGTLFPHHRLLGFDFTVNEDNKIVLFEINNLYIGVINQQMNTGPLFGSFTDEVIDYCKKNKKSVFFHYYI